MAREQSRDILIRNIQISFAQYADEDNWGYRIDSVPTNAPRPLDSLPVQILGQEMDMDPRYVGSRKTLILRELVQPQD